MYVCLYLYTYLCINLSTYRYIFEYFNIYACVFMIGDKKPAMSRSNQSKRVEGNEGTNKGGRKDFGTNTYMCLCENTCICMYICPCTPSFFTDIYIYLHVYINLCMCIYLYMYLHLCV
jgi:hypothetical protein